MGFPFGRGVVQPLPARPPSPFYAAVPRDRSGTGPIGFVQGSQAPGASRAVMAGGVRGTRGVPVSGPPVTGVRPGLSSGALDHQVHVLAQALEILLVLDLLLEIPSARL